MFSGNFKLKKRSNIHASESSERYRLFLKLVDSETLLESDSARSVFCMVHRYWRLLLAALVGVLV